MYDGRMTSLFLHQSGIRLEIHFTVDNESVLFSYGHRGLQKTEHAQFFIDRSRWLYRRQVSLADKPLTAPASAAVAFGQK